MDFETEEYKDQLIECLEGTRNVLHFEYILDELNISPNKELSCFDGLSIFEKVLTIPNAQAFIELCGYHGSNFFKKNVNKNYPLHYAIESLSAENLKAILRLSLLRKSSSEDFERAQYWKIVNERSDVGGGNYLHFLINKLTKENYTELSEMIRTMVANQCSVNAPNDRMETPFYLLLTNPFIEIDLIEYFVENTIVDNYSYKGDEITSLMAAKGIQSNRIKKREEEVAVDVDFITQHLGYWDGPMFDKHLALLQKNSQNFKLDMVMLLEEAVSKNLPQIVGTLLAQGVDTNGTPPSSKLNLTPAFLASALGHHQVLKVLLTDENISFVSTILRRGNRAATLLHQIFIFDFVDAVDRIKCFKLIIADKRCTLEIINQVDCVKHVPLHYSCKFGCDDISKELLRRGAYIGYESVMNYIQKDVVEEFLDGKIKWSGNVNDADFEVSIDYKFLTPPTSKSRKLLEMTAAHMLSTHSILKTLVVHPVISTFALLKWKRINVIVNVSVVIYFGFLLLLGFTIMNFYNNFEDYKFNTDYCQAVGKESKALFKIDLLRFKDYTDDNTTWLLNNLNEIKNFDGNFTQSNGKIAEHTSFLKKVKFRTHFQEYLTDHWLLYYIAIIGLLLMTVYELVQFKMSWRKYFFKLINWIDILLIGFLYIVLIINKGVSGPESFRRTCAIMILLMGAQCISLFSKISFFSLSLHLAILRRVSTTFLKTMAPYLIIILAFGMSFYALKFRSKKDELLPGDSTLSYDGFANIFLSVISTVRMMMSDFGTVTVLDHEYFKGFLLLGFIVVISIIVFNLLNALAISDTNGMMEVAELIETTRRISTLRTYDSLFSRFKVTTFNMFPSTHTIMLTPNHSNVIRIKNQNPKSDQVSIRMPKIGESLKYEYLFNGYHLLFWKLVQNPMEFDDKVVTKLVDYVKAQQAKQQNEMEKMENVKERNAMRNALDALRESLNVLQIKYDEKNVESSNL